MWNHTHDKLAMLQGNIWPLAYICVSVCVHACLGMGECRAVVLLFQLITGLWNSKRSLDQRLWNRCEWPLSRKIKHAGPGCNSQLHRVPFEQPCHQSLIVCMLLFRIACSAQWLCPEFNCWAHRLRSTESVVDIHTSGRIVLQCRNVYIQCSLRIIFAALRTGP